MIRIIAGLGGLSLFAFGLGLAAPSAEAASAVKLAPHLAIYDLKLGEVRGKRSLESVTGRIVYDFSGNACEGYRLQFRQVSELDNGEGKSVVSDLRSDTLEEPEAKRLRFQSRNILNAQPADPVQGEASRSGGTVAVELAAPKKKSFEIDQATVFPTQHLLRILEAATDGKTLAEMPVFDGSETGEKVYHTLAIIGRPIAPDDPRKPDDAAATHATLTSMMRWPVTISYFEKGASTGEQIPAYSIRFELYENGISRALSLDYGDFVVTGTMTALELKEAKACP